MQLGEPVCWRYEAVDPYLGGCVSDLVAGELRAMLSGRIAQVTAAAGHGREAILRAVQYLVRAFDVSALLEGRVSGVLRLFVAVDDGVFEHAASITETDCIEWNIETWVLAFTARWSGNPAAWPIV